MKAQVSQHCHHYPAPSYSPDACCLLFDDRAFCSFILPLNRIEGQHLEEYEEEKAKYSIVETGESSAKFASC